jgi:hypothetical protein
MRGDALLLDGSVLLASVVPLWPAFWIAARFHRPASAAPRRIRGQPGDGRRPRGRLWVRVRSLPRPLLPTAAARQFHASPALDDWATDRPIVDVWFRHESRRSGSRLAMPTIQPGVRRKQLIAA